MLQAKQGDTVKVNYSMGLEDGTVIDNTNNREPYQFTIGKDEVIPGFEEAVLGMNEGESKTVKVLAEKAFGFHKEENIIEIKREKLPKEIDVEVEVGKKLMIPTTNGRKMRITVTNLSESTVTFDINHPLSGKDLVFDIELLKIN